MGYNEPTITLSTVQSTMNALKGKDLTMYITVNEHDFIDAFSNYGRLITETHPEGNFTMNGLRALFEYLEDMEAGTDEPIELDVIGLCCEFEEWPSASYAYEMGYLDPSDYDDYNNLSEDDREDQARDYFRDNTTFIEFGGGVIIGEV